MPNNYNHVNFRQNHIHIEPMPINQINEDNEL